MRDFWVFARMMGQYRGRLALALAACLVGASSLGAGLGGMTIVLQHILGGRGKNLPALMTELNEKLDGNSAARSLGLHVPEAWIARLPTDPFDAVVWTVVVLGVTTVIGAAANYLHAHSALTVAGWTLRDLRQRVFAHTVALPVATVAQRGPSALVSQVVFDTQQVWGGYVLLLQKTLAQVLKGSVAMAMAFYFDWRMAMVGVGVMFVLGLVIRRVGKKVRTAAKKGLEAQGELQRTTAEALAHLRVVKTNNAEQRESGRFAATTAVQLRQELRVRTGRSMTQPLSEMVGSLVLGVLAVIMANSILNHGQKPENFIATLAALALAANNLRPLTGLYTDLQATGAASTRLRELLGLQRDDARDAGKPALAPHRSSIELQGVTLTYPGAETPALRSVSLTVRHGETVAIVGPNGSGKTTLLSLLPRVLEPDRGPDGAPTGRVLVDGVDVAGVTLSSLRRQIGVVTQETALFKGSVFWNIAYGVEEGVSEERVREAARKARAEEFIAAKPGGYEFEIGEGGSGLSGGQRQRLCIARAVLRDPSILILDEATSMVDADSERQIAEALAEFSRGRTCLIVAHRLSTVVHADRIVVMNAGRIEDVGTHAELLARSETYRLIAARQLLKADGGAGGGAQASNGHAAETHPRPLASGEGR